MLQNLLVCMHLKDSIKAVSDLAFDAIDDDGSGGLDKSEIAKIMEEVSKNMGVTAPTDEDLDAFLRELDDDFDGNIDKGEFLNLVMLVIGKMLETEEELQEKINQEIRNENKHKNY